MHVSTLLLVDDDPVQRAMQAKLLQKRLSCRIEEAEDGEQALLRLADPDLPPVSLVLLDLGLPGMDGREVLNHIRFAYPWLPVILVTGNKALDDAVEMMRRGASDFITKPFAPARLENAVSQYLPALPPVRTLAHAKGEAERMADSPGIEAALNLARRAARSSIPVLISGESGTGKEKLARAIHQTSERRNRPFVAINCGAIPEHLMESLLFGHEKGAFTGAASREIGKFREAEGGTLLLDEIGELKPQLQTRLLRVLQEREVEPVGGRAVRIDVRIIAATHRHLARDVADGRFRADLYYRLNVFPIHLPRLAERRGDIPALAQHLLARLCGAERLEPRCISDSGLQWLALQPWPGNVREMENLLYRTLVTRDAFVLDAQDFECCKDESLPALHSLNHEMVSLLHPTGEAKHWDELEADILDATLKRCGYQVSDAARLLQIGQSTLYKKISDYRIGKPVL